MRKVAIIAGIVLAAIAGTADAAQAAPTKPKNPVVWFKDKKVKQEAYWALSWNYPGVVVCVTKGDKSEAVYKIAQLRKAFPKLGYYWGGPASKRYDKMCNRK